MSVKNTLSMIRVLSVVGARPQFVKAAAVSRAFTQVAMMQEVMVHTGQHFDHGMSDVFFEELEIPKPHHRLDIHGGTHGEMTGRMLPALESIMALEKPDMVVVYGDTNSTLAGALAAAKLHLPIAHVEAGLRSFNRKMPEEVNRVLTDHVSALLFCPTSAAVKNLHEEGIKEGVLHVGDVMYDATLHARRRSRATSKILSSHRLRAGAYAVATVHRAENTDDEQTLAQVVAFLSERTRQHPVVLPLHPRTRNACARHGISLDGLTVVEPLGYLDMTALVASSAAVYTDSGGLQKEAYFHGVPCVTLRNETEWVETVRCGWNRLWRGGDFLPRRTIDEYGDGSASMQIVDAIQRYFESAGGARA